MTKKLLFIVFFFLFFSCESNYKNKTLKSFVMLFGTTDDEVEVENFPKNHFVLPELPDKIIFAGEEIHFKDWDLRERMDRELIVNNFWHSNTVLMMKRANRWMPMIKKILNEENIPEDLAYIALIESGLTNAVSPAGARGFWQFMEATGKEYNLKINKEIDERYHAEKSTYAACKYLKNAYRKFGTWTLAAAAYNRGMNGIERDLNQQKASSFFDLSLNEETSRYVFRLFALKLIFENPKEYGFYLEKEILYPPYNTIDVEINSTIEDVYDWAIENGVSVKILRKLNPWIIGRKITLNAGEKTTVQLPKNKKELGIIGK